MLDHIMTPRLLALAQQVPEGASLADIGTDHGYIPVYLAANGRIRRAVAADVNPGPLQQARAHIEKYGTSDRVVTALSNGLDNIPLGDIDTILIAGMGGLLIAEILERAELGAQTLILQPMTARRELRLYLHAHGFQLQEQLVEESDKIYDIFTCTRGEQTYPPVFYITGPCAGDALFQKRLSSYIKKLQQAIAGLKKARDGQKLADCEALLQEFYRLQEGK